MGALHGRASATGTTFERLLPLCPLINSKALLYSIGWGFQAAMVVARPHARDGIVASIIETPDASGVSLLKFVSEEPLIYITQFFDSVRPNHPIQRSLYDFLLYVAIGY